MNSIPVVLAVLAALLGCSALFSSSETALFKLTPAEARQAGRRVEKLVHTPRDLLITVLFGNLVVNLLFFAMVARLGGLLEAPLVVGAGALICVLIFGEILPKSLGLVAPVKLASLTAPPLTLFVALTGPVRRVMRWVLEFVGRLLGDAAIEDPHLRPADLEAFFEKSAKSGHLLTSEADLLVEIAELESIRLRQVMTPRVDALFLALNGSDREAIGTLAAQKRLARLPVIDGDPDHIVGQVRVRDLLVFPERSIEQMMLPVPFVPEVASCMDGLHGLRNMRGVMAVVVDEWGGTAGVVTLEDIFEEIVGDLRVEGEEREVAVIPLGEGRFRLAGHLSMLDWNEGFGFDVVPMEFETVCGFVTTLLGRIPRAGDSARWGDLVFEVADVRERRVVWVDMSVAEEVDSQIQHQPAMGGRRDRR